MGVQREEAEVCWTNAKGDQFHAAASTTMYFSAFLSVFYAFEFSFVPRLRFRTSSDVQTRWVTPPPHRVYRESTLRTQGTKSSRVDTRDPSRSPPLAKRVARNLSVFQVAL